MAYDEKLAHRIRERLMDLPAIEEKEMMDGLTFMVNGKMCVGIIKDEMMCRIDPELHEKVVEMTACRTMDFSNTAVNPTTLIQGLLFLYKNGITWNRSKKDLLKIPCFAGYCIREDKRRTQSI